MSAIFKGIYRFFFPADAKNLETQQTVGPDGEVITVTGRKCRHRADISPEPCPECKRERSDQLKYRWRIILCLVLPLTISGLDITIIASALPWIAADFDQVPQLNWIIAAFNLTAAAFIPFWGQMADIFGRHVAIQACMIIALVGAAICTGTPTKAFGLLLFGRALQGIGCAGMNVVIRAIVADKVSLREDAKNWSIFSLVGGFSFALGPIIGGYLTATSWRWCFGISLPVGVAACLVVAIFLRPVLLGPQPLPMLHENAETGRKSTFKERIATVDVGGQLLCLFGFGLIILAFTWAGATYAWDTAAVLVPLISGFAIITAFIWWQRQMETGRPLARAFPKQQAMIPWEVIKNRDIGLLFFTSFASGMAMYAVLYFCSLYFTMVKHLQPEEAGRALLFFVPGIGGGVYIAIFLCNSYPRQTWHPIMLGAIIEAVGIGVLAWAIWVENDSLVYGMMAVTGVGVGARFMPVPLHGMGYFPHKIAAVISLSEVSDPFGGTLGLTLMTTVFNNVANFGADSATSGNDFAALQYVEPEQLEAITSRAKEGIVWAFVAICPFMLLCVVASAFMGNVYLTSGATDEDELENQVYEGIYLWAVLRGEKIDENSEKVRVTRRATYRETDDAAAPGGNKKDDVELSTRPSTTGEVQLR